MHNELFSMLITQTWQVTVLIVVVWIVVRLWAIDRPHLAHSLWLLVLLKCITPPIWSSPSSPFSWLNSQSVTWPDVTAHLAGSGLTESGLAVEEGTPAAIVVHVQPVDQLDTNKLQLNNLTSAKPPTEPSIAGHLNDRDWRSSIVAMWIAGAGISLAVTLIRFAMFLVWLRRSPRADEKRIGPLLEQLSRRLQVKRRVRVVILKSHVGPAVLGLLRPTVLLPASITGDKSDAELEPLLAHELIHIRRGDLWWALVQTIAVSLFWFHPLVWFAVRMVTRESERSCDEETVASLGCRPAVYARGLLQVLEHKHQLRVASALPGVRPVDITSARLERVMRLGNGSHRRTPVWVWLVMFICGALVLPGAAIVLAQDQPTGEPFRLPSIGQQSAQNSGLLIPQAPSANVDQGNLKLTSNRPTLQKASYQVGDLLSKIRQSNLGGRTAEEKLLSWLPRRAPMDYVPSQSSSYASPNLQITGEEIIVIDTTERIAAIEEAIEKFRKYGFDQIVVEVRFITTSDDEFKKLDVFNPLDIDWSVAESTVGQPISNKAILTNGFSPSADFIPGFESDSNQQRVSSVSYVEKSSPVLHALLNEKQAKALVQKIIGSTKSNILQAPTVTMFNGQDASVTDAVTRPFVVGVQKLKDAKGTVSKNQQPVVRTIEDGIKIDLRPVFNGEDIIQLICQLKLSHIRSVESLEVPVATGAEPVNIQIPEVETIQIQTSIDVPNGESLLLRCLQDNIKGQKQNFFALITCRAIDQSATNSIETID